MTRIKPPGPAANKDPKLRLIRKAMSNVAAGTYGIGGRLKTRNKGRPITLPKIKGTDGN